MRTKSRLIVDKQKTSLRSAFKPANLLSFQGGEPGFRYRWIRMDDKANFFNGTDHRGWELVRAGASSGEEAPLTGSLSQFSSQALNSVIRSGDAFLARMPEKKADERNEYYAKKAADQVANVRNPMKKLKSEYKAEHSKFFSGSVEETHELKPVRGQVDLGE